MSQRPVLYFIDPMTRDLRTTPPTANGSALNTWEVERARFIERWDRLSRKERDQRIDAAIAVRENRQNTAEH